MDSADVKQFQTQPHDASQDTMDVTGGQLNQSSLEASTSVLKTMSVPNLQGACQAGPMLLENSFAIGDESIQILQANHSVDSLDAGAHLQQTNASSNGAVKKPKGTRKKTKVVQQPPRELTEEEKRQLEKQKKQADYLAELELLVSDDCPKSHPFDFRLIDLAEIKKQFPENAPKMIKVSSDGKPVEKYISSEPYASRNPKSEGIEIRELIKHFSRIMQLRPDNEQDMQQLQQLAEKLDNKSEERITWKEFLRFLDNEGLRREMVNDAQLYGVSVKRLEEFSRKSLKENKNQQETFIENCVFINHGMNFKFLLCLFDKKARIFDTKTYAVVQELTYKSGYDLASQTKLYEENQRAAAEAAAYAAEKGEQSEKNYQHSSANDKQRFMMLEASMKNRKTTQISDTNVDDDKGDNKQVSTRSSQKKFGLNLAPTQLMRSQSGNEDKLNSGSVHSRRQFSRGAEQKDVRIKSYSTQKLRSAGAIKTRMAEAANALKNGQKLNVASAKDLAEHLHKNVAFPGSSYTYSTQQKLPTLSKNIDSSEKLAAEIMKGNTFLSKDDKQKEKSMIALKQRQMLQKVRRPVKLPKEERWVLGVLGHKPLTENDDQKGLFSSQKQDNDGRGFGMSEIMPNLKNDFNSAQSAYFEKCEQKMSRQLRVGEARYKKLKREREAKEQLAGLGISSSPVGSKLRKSQDKRDDVEETDAAVIKKTIEKHHFSTWFDDEGNRPYDARDEAVQIMREQREKILRQRASAENRIKELGGGIDGTKKELTELSWTNEHFYRRSSPSPRTIAYQQYLKRQLQHKGVDTENQMEVTKHLNAMGVKVDIQTVRNITETIPEGVNEKNYCSPDKIARYVEDLKKAEPRKPKQADGSKSSMLKKETKQDGDQLSEKNAFKEVYALCATYNEELGILAVSLIDRQIKIYKIKQNGAKVQFQESFSFWANYYITCVCIARSVENSRPILCMGAQSGDIQIVYLDEQVIDPCTRKPTGELCAKELTHSPFGFFSQVVAPPKKKNVAQDDAKKKLAATVQVNTQSELARSNILLANTMIDSAYHSKKIVEETSARGSEEDERAPEPQQRTTAPPAPVGAIKNFDQVVGERVDEDDDYDDESDEYGSSQTGRRQKKQVVVEPPRELTPQELVEKHAWAFDFDRVKKNRKLVLERKKQRRAPLMESLERSIAINDSYQSKPDPRPLCGKKNQKAQVPTQVRRDDQPQRPSRNQWEQVRITQVRYVRDIGLIASAFNGTIKFFDPFDFSQQFQSGNDDHDRNEEYHTNITHFDISEKLSLLATGGAEGKLLLIDPYAQGVIKCVKAHHDSEILQVYIYDEQQQIMTVAADRTVGVWNTRLEKIQFFKDNFKIQATKFSSSCFDPRTGKLFVCCTKINVWKARVDQNVEINALQRQNLSKNVLRQRKMLDQQDPLYDPAQIKPGAWKLRDTDERTGSVLVTAASTLVEIIINRSAGCDQFIITIDSENLLRVWDSRTSTTTTTYQIACFGRVTAVAVDDDNKYIAIGTSFGEAKVLNMRSGGILYELKTPPKLKVEISFLRFSVKGGLSEFWLYAGCWGGHLLMWNKPTEDNNFNIDVRNAKSKKANQNHLGDIISLDRSEQMIVSGDSRGLINIWNALTGEFKHGVRLAEKVEYERAAGTKAEERIAQTATPGLRQSFKGVKGLQSQADQVNLMCVVGRDVRRSIVGICFHPHYDNLICVLQESGHIHLLDGTNGDVPFPNVQYTGAITQQINACWACDAQHKHMFVVGDSGTAVLYDISMLAPMSHRALPSCNLGFTRKNAPDPHWVNSDGVRKWEVICKPFKTHDISGMDGSYVVTAKHAKNARTFVTGTTTGEVRIWSEQTCEPLGTLNVEDWDATALMRHMRGEKKKPAAVKNEADMLDLDEPELCSEGEE